MQKAIFPILKTWESQAMGVGSHKETKALDFGVLSPYKDTKLTAPFDGKVVFVDSQAKGGLIAFESLEKVQYANGTKDYMTLLTGHDNKPPKVGTIYKQGEHYSNMGTAGGVATHCHLEVQKGKFKMTNKLTSQKAYKFENTIEPFKALYVREDCLIKYSDYKWTTLPDTIGTPIERNEYIDQIEVIAEVLRARKEPSLNGAILGYINQGIYNILSTTTKDNYTWYEVEPSIWIAYNKEWEILYPRKETEEEILKKEIVKLQETNEQLQQNITQLQLNNEQLSKEINNLKSKLTQIHEISK